MEAQDALDRRQVMRRLSVEFANVWLNTKCASLKFHSLAGGLEAAGVMRVTAAARGKQASFVVKHLSGTATREANTYRRLEKSGLGLSPKLLDYRTCGTEGYLFMEWVPKVRAWPWRDSESIRLMVNRLVTLHSTFDKTARAVPDWNYETELSRFAAETVESYRRLSPPGRPMARTLERMASQIVRIRQQLLNAGNSTLIHGDAHPGNAIISRRSGSAILIDWGRSRIGSPLEDLSSWLQSLAFWEPEARIRHDQFLRQYVSARGWGNWPGRELRDLYWFAAATNAFAGALHYHLAVAADPTRSTRVRESSMRAVSDWLRMIRRADERWRATR